MKKISIAIVFASILSYTSCNMTNGEQSAVNMDNEPIVTVNENTLYLADLNRVVPISFTGEDSINAANEYIITWINEQLVYDKAKQNTANPEAINQLVEEYRKALISNSYKERILREHFSKSITEDNLKTFFQQNTDLFKLEECIIKGLYLKIPANSPELNNFRRWYTQSTENAIESIEKNTLQHIVNYEYFYNKWVPLSDVMNNIPQIVTDYDQFLRTHKNIEVQDSTYVYLLNIKEYKTIGDEAPYEYVKEQLPEAFKEKNRSAYLDRIQKDLYNKALSNKQIKYYKE